MALALQDMPCTLNTLASQMKGEKKVSILVSNLTYKSTLVVSQYTNVFENQGSCVLKKKEELLLISDPTEIDVQDLENSLDTFKAGLCAATCEMKLLEHTVHSGIADCESRQTKHESTITREEVSIAETASKMTECESRVLECEKAATQNEEEAKDFNQRARAEEAKEEKSKNTAIIGGTVGTAAAIFLAPFSGGASLALAAGTAGLVGGSLIVADELRKKARHFESIAKTERDNAQAARTKVSELKDQISVCKKNIERSRSKCRNLRRTHETLDLINGTLLSYVSLMNRVEEYVQDLNTSIHAAITEGVAFSMIQQALSECPVELEGLAREAMLELREKWKAVENEIRVVTKRV